jgi:hypothetical protein
MLCLAGHGFIFVNVSIEQLCQSEKVDRGRIKSPKPGLRGIGEKLGAFECFATYTMRSK